MHFDAFDSFLPRDSVIHRLDPRTKILCTLLFILSVVLLPDGAWLGFALAWLLLFGITRAAELPAAMVLKRSLVAVPFALAALTLPFTLPGSPIAAWKIGTLTFIVSDAGLLRFTGIVIRSWLAVQAAILLTASTLFPDIVHGLRHLRVPDLITGILAFMYRYLFILADEALRLLRAREARSAASTARQIRPSIRWRAGVAGGMVGQLFLRSLDRSDRVFRAMQARGYAGELLTMNPHIMTRTDWAWLIAALLAVLIPHLVS